MEIKNLYEVSGFTFDNKKQAEYFISLVEGKNFDEKQLKEIHEGLESGLDVSIYAKKEYKSKEMNEIRLSLLSGNFKPKTFTKIKMFIQKIKGN